MTKVGARLSPGVQPVREAQGAAWRQPYHIASHRASLHVASATSSHAAANAMPGRAQIAAADPGPPPRHPRPHRSAPDQQLPPHLRATKALATSNTRPEQPSSSALPGPHPASNSKQPPHPPSAAPPLGAPHAAQPTAAQIGPWTARTADRHLVLRHGRAAAARSAQPHHAAAAADDAAGPPPWLPSSPPPQQTTLLVLFYKLDIRSIYST
nr:vegetative cell wall protein gp1-like [Lolium perenne]